MSLRNVPIKRSYSSDVDDIAQDFYVPILAASVEYRRLAGFFSSTSIALAAKGIAGLIENGGVMKLLVSPKLTRDDRDAIVAAQRDPTQYLGMCMLRELEEPRDEFVRHHVRALGWMVARGTLEIRVCLPCTPTGEPECYESAWRRGIFHQKVGVLLDRDGSVVTFSGSVNESASGWLDNIEEFKVFRSWEPLEKEYQQPDIDKFDRFWNGTSPTARTLSVPEAVRDHLINIAPDDLDKAALQRSYSGSHRPRRNRVKLFSHQQDAVDAWFGHGKRGIFAMATGTGKTIAALGCLQKALAQADRLAVIVACPHNHLIQQWREEAERFGIGTDSVQIADSTNPGWGQSVARVLVDMELGYLRTALILTTHDTLSSTVFRQIMTEHASELPVLLVADEMHSLGAPERRKGLLAPYDCRLGLSATPVRMFDEEGTDIIDSYFGGTVYEFPLEKAINTINPATGRTYLAPYEYVPHLVTLTDQELDQYYQQTLTIAQRYGRARNDEEGAEALKRLIFKRAMIVKDAENKHATLATILDELEQPVKWTLVYCSPGQIERVMALAARRGLVAHRFTMAEGTRPEARYGGTSEREFLLRKFEDTTYDVLVAMKCLDEGVDIPPARTAILMASSQNPRQYVQRIGRVLRPCPGKQQAVIHDMIVAPSLQGLPDELRRVEKRIFEKEVLRCELIARAAANPVAALSAVYEYKETMTEGMG